MNTLAFYAFAVIAVLASLGVIGQRNPMHSVMLLITSFGALLFFYVWMRWTLPRYRYDQLMAFGWKILLPLSVVNLLVTAAGVLYFGL